MLYNCRRPKRDNVQLRHIARQDYPQIRHIVESSRHNTQNQTRPINYLTPKQTDNKEK